MKRGKSSQKEVKIILLGNSSVGKTSIINRYIKNTFNMNITSSLGSQNFEKVIQKGKETYKLIIWDTTGQEKYHSLTNLFINKSNIVILTYSIDNIKSFIGLDYWYNCVEEKLEKNKYILAVVGNKSDLINDKEEEVNEEEGKEYAKEKNAFFKLISAKEDPNGINDLFETLLDELINSNIGFFEDIKDGDSLNKKNGENKEKKCC